MVVFSVRVMFYIYEINNKYVIKEKFNYDLILLK